MIANSTYSNAPPLPNTQDDADAIARVLSKAQFKITRWKDIETAQDFGNRLAAVLRDIKKGSIVAFFYSGHGFSFNGGSYLVPTKAGPADLNSLNQNFVSVDAVKNVIEKTRPAFAFFALDACRSPISYTAPLQPLGGAFTLGGAEEVSIGQDGLIWSAAGRGRTAIARDKLSYFSEAMSLYLAERDTSIHEIEGNVIEWVKENSHDAQIPISSATLTGSVYLNDTSRTRSQIKEVWASTVRRGTAGEVTHFLSEYRGTVYEYSAQRWLLENANLSSRYFTEYSPLMVEDAWQHAHQTTSHVLVAQIAGSFVFDRVLTTRSPVTISGDLFKGDMTAPQILEKSERAFVKATLVPGRAHPRIDDKPSRWFGMGDKLSVLGTVTNDDGVWLSVEGANDARSYIKVPSDVRAQKRDLGVPTHEIFVGPRPDSLRSLADKEAIESLASSCGKMSWASIGVPYLKNPDEQSLVDLRASNAALVLTETCAKKGRNVRGLIGIVRHIRMDGDLLRIRTVEKATT